MVCIQKNEKKRQQQREQQRAKRKREDEQQRIDDAWKKIHKLYIEYQIEQPDQARVSMFSGPPTSGDSINREREESEQNRNKIG